MDWTMCFLAIASGLVRMLGASCVVCKRLLFLHSFNKLNLIFSYYSSITSWCVLSGTSSECSSKRRSIQILFVLSLCPFWLFPDPFSVVGYTSEKKRDTTN